MTVPQGNAGGSRKKEKPAIPANITSNAANSIITSSGFTVGTVTNTPGTLEGQHVAGNVAIAVNDTSVAPLGSSINYTIYSPYFPPFFPPYFPPYFPPFFPPPFDPCAGRVCPTNTPPGGEWVYQYTFTTCGPTSGNGCAVGQVGWWENYITADGCCLFNLFKYCDEFFYC